MKIQTQTKFWVIAILALVILLPGFGVYAYTQRTLVYDASAAREAAIVQPKEAAAAVNRPPLVYDATGAMMNSIVLPEQAARSAAHPLIYDATGVMLNSIVLPWQVAQQSHPGRCMTPPARCWRR
jgi:hypothetical protein